MWIIVDEFVTSSPFVELITMGVFMKSFQAKTVNDFLGSNTGIRNRSICPTQSASEFIEQHFHWCISRERKGHEVCLPLYWTINENTSHIPTIWCLQCLQCHYD